MREATFANQIIEKMGTYKQAQELPILLQKIKEAKHFYLPPGGKLLDQNDKGLEYWSDLIKLPFDNFTVSFFSPWKDGTPGINKFFVQVIRTSLMLDYMDIKDVENGDFLVCEWWHHSDVWCPPVSFNHCKEGKPLFHKNEAGNYVSTYSQLKTWDGLGAEKSSLKSGAVYETMMVISQMLGVLNCENVETEIVKGRPEKKDRKGRLVKRELPDFRVIRIKGSKSGERIDGSSGSDRSPRSHWRRGHIRRLEKGAVWVRYTIVNAHKGDPIKTEYRVSS